MTIRPMNRIPVEGDASRPANSRPMALRASGSRFEVRSAGDAAEIALYDEIGAWGVSAKDFRAELGKLKAGTIRLAINSPGGDVFDGIAIYNDLVTHPARVEVTVTGLAASAASVVAMAGDTIAMASNAFMMIHDAWVFTMGGGADLRELAALLDKIDLALADTYAARTGGKRDEIAALMDAETWFSAEQAVAAGFADRALGKTEQATAKFDLSAFRNAPQGLACDPGRPCTIRDFERALTHDAGLSRSEARALMRRGFDGLSSMRDAGANDLSALRDALTARAGLFTR